MKKRVFAWGLSVFMIFMAGCGSNKEPAAQAENSNSNQQSAAFGFITGTGGLGDKNMNDATYEGIKTLEKKGAVVDAVEPDDASDFTNLQELFAETAKYNTIFCISYEQTDALKKTAQAYPEQSFVLVDSEVDADNVTNVLFRPEETGFQLGVLSGLLEKENALPFLNEEQKVGFVGGQDNPIINKFAAGYEAGARLVNPEVEVEITYVGSFSDPSKASELSNGLYENGCDIIFACAGGSGLGVFTSAEKNDGYALGIEVNQNGNAPDNIIASGLRLWNIVMADVGEMAAAGRLESGTLTYGIKENTLEVGFEDSNVEVSEEIKKELQPYFDKVAGGEYVLPSTLAEVDSFLADHS